MSGNSFEINCRVAWTAVGVALSIVSFFLLAAVYISQPLADPDFWWHLKTGELLVKGGTLLPSDPFNFSSVPDQVSLRERVILDGYWLWQVAAYGFHRSWGAVGIKGFNALALVGGYAVVGFALWRNRVRWSALLLLLLGSLALMQRFFFLERPQIFSFFLAAVLVNFFVAIRRGDRPSWGLFPLMALWGNLHGGVVVGATMILLFAVSQGWEERLNRERQRHVLFWCVGGLVASLLNPGGVSTYLALFQFMGQDLGWMVKEYQPTLSALSGEPLIWLLFLFCLLHFYCLWRAEGAGSLSDWVISLLLVTLAFKHIRNIPFMTISLLPMTGYCLEKTLSAARETLQGFGHKCWPLISMLALAHSLSVVSFAAERANRGEWGDVSLVYPKNLVTFLQEADLKGNIYNDYSWGGFLLYSLYPQYRFFIDGRGIDAQAMMDSRKIGEASLTMIDGRPEYERLLDKYHISAVVMGNEIGYTGINPLLKFLLNKPEWVPVYLDDQSHVLVRAGENRDALLEYGIEKKVFLQNLLSFLTSRIMQNPTDVKSYLARGELLGYMGYYAAAAQDFSMVKQISPDNSALPAKLKQLDGLRERIRRDDSFQ